MPNVFVINIHPENWDKCKEQVIFGFRKGSVSFPFEVGDIFLIRVTGKDYGVKGIWSFVREEKVTDEIKVPWEDAEYKSIIYFSPFILEFKTPFREDFTGKSKYSEKVKMSSGRIIGTIARLTYSEGKNYISALLAEKSEELKQKAEYMGSEVIIFDFFNKLIEDFSKKNEKTEIPVKKVLIEDLVGDPINFRGIVYAPMNEAGVILLFSKVMEDLGIFYESSPSTSFPDMIGRRRTDKGLKRAYIEFEYKSKHFLQHKHDPKLCDMIVCWEHDWQDCPLEVIQLKEVIETLRE